MNSNSDVKICVFSVSFDKLYTLLKHNDVFRCAAEYLHCKAEIIKDIPLLEKTTPPLLVSAQACVARSMEENWYGIVIVFLNFSVFFAHKEKHFRWILYTWRKQNEKYLEIFHSLQNFRSYNASMHGSVPSLLFLVKWGWILNAIRITSKIPTLAKISQQTIYACVKIFEG